MLHVMKYRKKKSLIYDATSKHNSTTHPNSSFTQDYIDTNIRNQNLYLDPNKNQLMRHNDYSIPQNSINQNN